MRDLVDGTVTDGNYIIDNKVKDFDGGKEDRSGYLSLFHGIKGLEFKHVFLTDVNKRTLPFLPYNYNSLTEIEKQEILKKEKSLFYVASSRAIQRLVISGIGEKSVFVKI